MQFHVSIETVVCFYKMSSKRFQKIILRFLFGVFCFLLILAVQKQMNSQTLFASQEVDTERPEATTDFQSYGSNIPTWANSLYISAGMGYPNRMRIDVGYNILSYASVGFSINRFHQWSDDVPTLMFGFVFQVRTPIGSSPIALNLLYSIAESFEIFHLSDSNHLLFFGVIIPVISRIQCKPELGIIWRSKYISGGPTIWGTETPAIFERGVHAGGNLSFMLTL